MIVVTGGTGFIGSNLVAALEKSGAHDVIICDQLGTQDKWRNIAKREIADFIHPHKLLDFLDSHASEVHMIFHLGAISSTTETDADRVVQMNFNLSLALWKWCCRRGVRMIYASSAATYGDGSQGFSDNHTPQDLEKFHPLNVYGWSKHVFDRRVARFIKSGSVRPPQWVGLRFFNVYGPNEYHKGSQASVAWQLYNQIKDTGKARLFKSHHPDYADGEQMRDFIWVGDCVAVMMWLLENPEVNGIFNVGTGKARSFLDLAKATFKAMGKAPDIDFVETPIAIRDKYQYFTQAEMNNLRKAGFEGQFTGLEEGIELYVKEFLMAEDKYI